MKRAFDAAAAALALVLLSLFLLLLALAIKLDSRGPVFYRPWRVGKGEKPFRIFKFRTMVDNAYNMGTAITVRGDRRVTRLGRVLRRFEIDELPTLLNVLRGQMSIVGPRPEDPRYLPHYSPQQRRVFSLRPGMTDLGTLHFRDEAKHLAGEDPEAVYVTEILPRKLALNLQYLEKRSFRYDLYLILQTLASVVVQPKG